MTAIDDVRARLKGLLAERLYERGAPGFDELASVVYAGDDRTPALIARTIDAREVSAVVQAAAESAIPFAVRARGHSFARHGLVFDGLVLDLRLMDGVEIDVDARVGTAHAGTSTGSYSAAAAEHGLATGFGDNPDVGIPGLVLGGGIGFLSRRDGLTVDNLLEAEVVLADGGVVRASENERADLFWALRGGGGNFGVVTELRMRLDETPVITGGALVFEPHAATVAALVEAAREAVDAITLMINVTKSPPWPFVPEELHGTPVITTLICHAGRPADSEADLAPFRAAGPLIADELRPQPYPRLFDFAAEQTGTRTIRETGFLGGFDEATAAKALEMVGSAPTAVGIVNLRPMGGAIARVAPDATAFAHRDRAILATIRAIDRDLVRAEAGVEWAAQTAEALGIGGPANVNFLGEGDKGGVSVAYPEETLRRLREIKAIYDPDNVFQSNHNIVPAPTQRASEESGR